MLVARSEASQSVCGENVSECESETAMRQRTDVQREQKKEVPQTSRTQHLGTCTATGIMISTAGDRDDFEATSATYLTVAFPRETPCSPTNRLLFAAGSFPVQLGELEDVFLVWSVSLKALEFVAKEKRTALMSTSALVGVRTQASSKASVMYKVALLPSGVVITASRPQNISPAASVDPAAAIMRDKDTAKPGTLSEYGYRHQE